MRSTFSIRAPRPEPRSRVSQPSIRARSRITTPSSTIRCAFTRSGAPPAASRPRPMLRSRPGANGRLTCRALPSTAGIISPRRRRKRRRRRCSSFSPRPEGAPHTETGHQLIYCRPRLRGDDIGWVWRAMPSIDRQAAFSGTKEVADALAIDAARLEAFLASRLSDFAGPLGVRQFKGGQSNPTYLVQTPARRYVLRRKPPGKLLPSAHAVDREFRVISALHARGFPVAAPLLYCDDARVAGTPFYLMDHVEGRVVWEPHMPAAAPSERAAVYDAMNATFARLHGFDPATIGLGDFGRGDNYVARQVDRCSKQ